MKIVIKGRLAGLNEYIDECRKNPRAGARLKKQSEDIVKWSALKTLHGTIQTPVIMHYVWYEPNKKRDLDNVSAFGRKVIQDALVRIHILKGDGWAHIRGFTDRFEVDAKNPRIEITFESWEDKNE